MTLKAQPILTADQSRIARRELALSQKNVLDQTGIPAYKLKQFEAGSFRPDQITLTKLREFYEGQGVNFEELSAYIGGDVSGPQKQSTDQVPSARPLKDGFTYTPRPGFFIANDLPAEVVDQLMTDMETSDDRIADIIKTASSNGLLGDMTQETEALVQELFGHLAMNHLRFRCLQGRNIIEPTRDEAKTVGDVLSQWVRKQAVFMPISDKAKPVLEALDSKANSSKSPDVVEVE